MAPNTAWAVADYRGGIYTDSVRPTKRAAIDAFRERCGVERKKDWCWRMTAKIGPTEQLRAVKVYVTVTEVL